MIRVSIILVNGIGVWMIKGGVVMVSGVHFRSEESGDGVVGVAKVLRSVGEGSLDSWSDKAYPGF